MLLFTQHRLRQVILGHTSATPSINSSKRPCQTYLGNFHEYNVYVWRVGVYWNTCVKAELFFFINPFFKKPLGARGRGRRLPNQSHDCSLSRPSHTWTCHEFLWKRNARKTGKKKNLGQLAAVSPRLTCTQQESLAPGEPHSEWIVQHPTSRALSRPIGVEHCRSVRPRRERPSTNQSSVPWERVHRGTWPGYAVHVRGLGEVEHCCCVKCKRRSASVALLTSF